jgi:hypothetical protein
MGLAALQAELARSGSHPAQPGPDTAALAKSVRRPRGPVVAAGLVLALGAGGVGYYALARGAPPVEAEPDAGEAPVAAVAPLSIPLVTDSGFGLDTTLDTDEPEPDAGKGATAVRPHPPHGNGRVNVVTTLRGEPYWAAVLVDGVRRGTTPMLLELPAGRHALRVERLGFQSMNRQIKVAAGHTSALRLELQQ